MNKFFVAFVFVFSLFLVFVPLAEAELGNGQRVYTDNCIGCHGSMGDLKSSNGVDFSSSGYWEDTEDQEVLDAIEYGVGSMPSYSFSEKDLGDLMSYLEQFEKDQNIREYMMVLLFMGLGSLVVLSYLDFGAVFDEVLSLISFLVVFVSFLFEFFWVYDKTFLLFLTGFSGLFGFIYYLYRNERLLKGFKYKNSFFKLFLLFLFVSILFDGYLII